MSDLLPAEETQRATVLRLVEGLDPWDAVETEHQATALRWIRSGAQLNRTDPPDGPPIHLVSYFMPYDVRRQAVMLVAHRKSGLDLPPGGHCEPGESPWDTVERECDEELGIQAVPLRAVDRAPMFITVTATRPPQRHTDVSLWHLIAVDPDVVQLSPDPREFSGARWVSLEALLDEPIDRLDPHTHRFVGKLRAALPSH